jgi:hypothetical protein
LPNQNLQRQIDGHAGRRNHERSSGPRVTEDRQLGRAPCRDS